jgi:hypothetical protein
MSKDPRVTLVLILGGIGCIVASIAAVTYLYHHHAAEFAVKEDNMLPFALFVGAPSVAGFVVGAILLTIGIKRDRSP